MRRIVRAGLSAAIAVAVLAGPAAAQYRPGPGYGYEDEYEAPRPRRRLGYNCDAVQRGFTGPQPFSCPLPGPRPLGVRCFCDVPIASFSSPQPPAAGLVVP
ncbi:hypothetical protein [Methylobacterium oryzihabitans]|jgi:hypothetical protein|uniref:Uncharacterized protein n=1 Tax=Methylobacterium oryzihabitans TaxID=2499852 RepID=A0A3S2VND7_9HYPH|nr:hypothetical protein [Methylobacterium oryzihabitans]RVU16852.1 hypothetical protein EOE48_15420 [Methylobacterium oryzihabitans]